MSDSSYTIYTQSLQLRRLNDKGRHTLRFVWDVVSRSDSPRRLVIETWGGRAKGYAKLLGSDSDVINYLGKRLAKATHADDKLTLGISSNNEVDLRLVGECSMNIYDGNGEPVGYVSVIDQLMNMSSFSAMANVLEIEGERAWNEDASLGDTLDNIPDDIAGGVNSDILVCMIASRFGDIFAGHSGVEDTVTALCTFMEVGLSDVISPAELPGSIEPFTTADFKTAMKLANGSVRTVRNPRPTDEVAADDLADVLTKTEAKVKKVADAPGKKDYEAWGAWS